MALLLFLVSMASIEKRGVIFGQCCRLRWRNLPFPPDELNRDGRRNRGGQKSTMEKSKKSSLGHIEKLMVSLS